MQGTEAPSVSSATAECGREKEAKNDNYPARDTMPLAVVCIAIGLVVVGVHYKTISVHRTDISLPQLIESIETKCRSLGNAYTESSKPPLHPVPTQFGMAVWVEHEQWLPHVHDTLDQIERAVAVGLTRKSRFIQRIVRLETSRREKTESEGHGSLAAAAEQQQLGLNVAKHVYALDLREELLMHAISFMRVPKADASSIQCSLFEDRQAFCTIPDSATAEFVRREIPAAIATLIARWLQLDNFRDASVVRQWVTKRHAGGCQYALRSLQQLQVSMNAHSGMPVPESVHSTVDRLRSLVERGNFDQLARAADDLQFHQDLLPQIYIPWDQALVNHLSILMPVHGIVMLGLRLANAHWKRRRREKEEKKQQQQQDNDKDGNKEKPAEKTE
ncbi:hypothetical protein ERJ75_001645600 [Trypanosoma vivax]|nr:putative GPI transamidase component, Tta1 [Trypanosoma vivax]KAH8604967.1 hypothetical protein ERJ75_001645600 [Trypanosoma vivax]